METWKTRMNLAFPTFPQGLLPERRNGTESQNPNPKEGGLSTAINHRNRDLHPTVSSWHHPTGLVDAGHP